MTPGPAAALLSLLLALVLSWDAGGKESDPHPKPPSVLAPSVLTPSAGVSRTVPRSEDYPLRRAPDGSGDLVYDSKAFSARIARDGSVTFRDKGILDINLLSFLPQAAPSNVPSLQSTIMGLARDRKVPTVDESKPTDDSYLVIPNLTRYRPDAREGCRECGVPLSLLPLNVVGPFDLTDQLIRMNGKDPYRYEKARFLAITRDMRIRKAVDAHTETIRRAGEELPRHLVEIACDGRLTRRERREIIERLRAELDGTTPESRAASRQIEDFLQSHFKSTATEANDTCPR
jgi:hypothetical protein